MQPNAHCQKGEGKKKKISLNKERSKEETAAPAVSELISSRLEQKARRWYLGACVCMWTLLVVQAGQRGLRYKLKP